jgi:lycopene beta-cyclase
MPVDNIFEKIDYLFVGSGTSATLLLMSMEKNGLLFDKKIVIIDPDAKSINDKTFCFWNSNTEKSNLLCSHLISKEWNNFRRQDGTIENEQSLSYKMVQSADLYAEMKRIIMRYNITRTFETVTYLDATKDGVFVNTSERKRHARIVFDSRPPQFRLPKSNEAHLHQSFVGYFITCDRKNIDFEAIDLMDFEVAQEGETQFFYVLPFDENNLLVELTRFGKRVINEESASTLLNEYILKRFGNYTITAVERGNIPMSTASIHAESQSNVVLIGARSGAIKPSTGYAFKKMMQQAEIISAELLKNKIPILISPNNRFKRYDRLLLKILSNQPHLGKPIFQRLFSSNTTASVFRFLDEKTTFKEELKIFSTLPVIPFLIAFIMDVVKSKKEIRSAIFLLLLTLSLLAIQQANSFIFDWTNNSLLLGGLVAFGVPHGAVDHLLTSDNKFKRPTIGFIARYLFFSALIFIFWIIAPTLSLVLFILYSSWHFGESDIFHWGIIKYKITLSWLWGIVLLLFILSSHFSETKEIIAQLGINLPSVLNQFVFFINGGLIVTAVILSIVSKSRNMFFSLMILILASQLPLLTAFGLYFIGQHSINSWFQIKNGLKTTNKQLLLKALPFTLGALFLFAILVYFINKDVLKIENYNLVAFIFIFISCISLPHILVMHNFYKTISTKFL